MAAPIFPAESVFLVFIIDDGPFTQVFDARAQRYLKPPPEHCERSVRRPGRFKGVPALEFGLEDDIETLRQQLPNFNIVIVLREQIDGWLIVQTGRDTGVVKGSRPVNERLLWSDDYGTSIDH